MFKMTLVNLVSPAACPSEHNGEDTLALQCSICRETLGEPNYDGEIETAHVLPCSHIFGSACIARWLDASPHHDCPTCRRSMIYKICGHPIEALDVSKQPQNVTIEDMPEKCLLCRQGGLWEKRLAFLKERQHAEEMVLVGLGSLMSTDFGSRGERSTESVEERIIESRRRFKADIASTRIVLEKEVGKAW